ncbi:uncharacterized protein LOC122319659 [Drosophila yakuba]|uniref:uncharacterized protein LOC122319659 n=1 Tax=Drosophila yakuba TaxID=7245 RepID=UPI001C88E624|nr:uncharacterized protein LOC122319659 [Drosophila yakuba]
MCNAAQRMCRLMDKVVPAALREQVFVYLDDLLVCSLTFEEHLVMLGRVSDSLQRAKLTINVDKRCYRRFIQNYAQTASPLHDSLKKDRVKKFELSEAAIQAFESLKTDMAAAPVLVTPDFKKPFIIQCDASTTGVGGVLLQNDDEGGEHRIAYMSAKLNNAQRNYSITELECYAAILSITKFRAYVEGMPFKAFDFTIEHRRGSLNVVPDALSKVYMDATQKVQVTAPDLQIDLKSPFFQAPEYLALRANADKCPDNQTFESFMSLPSAINSNIGTVRKIADGADEVIRGLRALNCEERDPWLIFILLSKLDSDTRQAWAQCAESEEKGVTIHRFLKFLTSRCDTLEAFNLTQSTQARRAATTHHADTHPRREEPKCTSCQQNHQLFKCPQFIALDIASRRDFLKSRMLCFNCLSPAHMVGNCTSRHTCRICRRKHHTLVHGSSQPIQNGNNIDTASVGSCDRPAVSHAGSTIGHNQPLAREGHRLGSETPAENNFTHHTLENIPAAGSQTLLPTILADVIDAWGNTTTCRLLLDTGSTITLASESFVQRIGVRRTHARISILGLAANSAGVTRGRAHIKLRSRHSGQAVELVSIILNSLTSSLPAQVIDTSSSTWRQICELPLAAPTFCTPGAIDVIVGSDQLWSLYTGDRKHFGNGFPIDLNTVFGWILAGSYSAFNDYPTSAVTHHADLDTMVRSFMEMDSIQPNQALLDASDPTERHFAATHKRSTDGVYGVEYPFKEKAPPIDSTLPQAINRFFLLERKFRRYPELKQQYEAFLDDYLQRGHMEQLTSAQVEDSPDTCFYLPHHAVIKLDSLTTKCRVVFDGSRKDSSGVSLNDRQHIGPPIQRDLLGVCLRFRQHQYVLCADVEKMFRGIKIFKPHTNYQRIVWCKTENEPLLHFRLLTVTYGLAPSPFLAVRVLKQLADDHGHEYPAGAHALLHDAYVDDIPTGANTFEELMILKDELIALLDKGKFKLRKWSSNSWRLLKSLPEEDRCFEPIQLFNKSAADSPVKVLGIQWNPGKDVLYLNLKGCDATISPTKRELLSQLSRIYDPLGLVAPVTVLLKLIFQESWTSVLQWDDPIPEGLRTRWRALVEDLPALTQCQVPRYIASPFRDVQLHGFADASSHAYGAHELLDRFRNCATLAFSSPSTVEHLRLQPNF